MKRDAKPHSDAKFNVPDGLSVAWSVPNNAYFVMFGRGPVNTRSVLKITPRSSRRRRADRADSSAEG